MTSPPCQDGRRGGHATRSASRVPAEWPRGTTRWDGPSRRPVTSKTTTGGAGGDGRRSASAAAAGVDAAASRSRAVAAAAAADSVDASAGPSDVDVLRHSRRTSCPLDVAAAYDHRRRRQQRQ